MLTKSPEAYICKHMNFFLQFKCTSTLNFFFTNLVNEYIYIDINKEKIVTRDTFKLYNLSALIFLIKFETLEDT